MDVTVRVFQARHISFQVGGILQIFVRYHVVIDTFHEWIPVCTYTLTHTHRPGSLMAVSRYDTTKIPAMRQNYAPLMRYHWAYKKKKHSSSSSFIPIYISPLLSAVSLSITSPLARLSCSPAGKGNSNVSCEPHWITEEEQNSAIQAKSLAIAQ